MNFAHTQVLGFVWVDAIFTRQLHVTPDTLVVRHRNKKLVPTKTKALQFILHCKLLTFAGSKLSSVPMKLCIAIPRTAL